MSDNFDELLKSLDEITKLGSIIRQNRKDKHFEEALSNCEKIIQIVKRINRDDLVDKNTKLKEEIEKEREKFREYDEVLKEIEKLDKIVNQNLENKRFDDALRNCDNIIQIAESINKKDFIDKYNKLKVKINKEALKIQKKKKPIEKLKTIEKESEKFREYDEVLKEIEKLDKIVNQNLENKRFDDALTNCDNIVQKAKKINRDDIIEKYLKLKEEIKKETEAAKDQEEKLNKIKNLEKIINQYIENKQFDEVLSNCDKIIERVREINRNDLIDKYSKLKEQINIEIDSTKEQEEKLKEIEILENLINVNIENEQFDEALNNCDKIVQRAKSINRKDLIDKYRLRKKQIKEEAREYRKQQKLMKKPKVMEKKAGLLLDMPTNWRLLCILGGLLLIISYIGDIAILFIRLFILIVFGMGTTSGNILIIILFVLGAIAIGGGILIIIGALIITKYRVGKICIGTGFLIDLIGLLIFLRIGLIVAELYSSFIKLTVVLIIVCFVIGLIGLLLVAFFLIKFIRLRKISE